MMLPGAVPVRSPTSAGSRGFGMIEVMVALVVISVGLLGIAKMQALAMASTGTARTRSIAALQAASLAATLRADRAYWSATATPFTVSIQNGSVTAATDSALLAATTCNVAGACKTPVRITAYDLQDWAKALGAQLPNSQATVTCGTVGAPAPVSCTIDINWIENRVGVNKQSDGKALPTSFRLYVEP